MGLVELMQSWISTNQAYLTVDSFQMQLDPGCGTRLDTLNEPGCPPGVIVPGSTSTESPGTGSGSSPSPERVDDLRPGEVGGIIVGMLIILLLLAVIAALGVLLLYKRKKLKRAR